MTEMDPTERSPKLPADGEEERSGYKPFGGSQRVPEERHEGIMRSRVFLLIIRNGPVWCRETGSHGDRALHRRRRHPCRGTPATHGSAGGESRKVALCPVIGDKRAAHAAPAHWDATNPGGEPSSPLHRTPAAFPRSCTTSPTTAGAHASLAPSRVTSAPSPSHRIPVLFTASHSGMRRPHETRTIQTRHAPSNSPIGNLASGLLSAFTGRQESRQAERGKPGVHVLTSRRRQQASPPSDYESMSPSDSGPWAGSSVRSPKTCP